MLIKFVVSVLVMVNKWTHSKGQAVRVINNMFCIQVLRCIYTV